MVPKARKSIRSISFWFPTESLGMPQHFKPKTCLPLLHLRKLPSQAVCIPPRKESALQSMASATEQTLTQLAAHESTCKRSCAHLFSWFEKEKEMSEKILEFFVVPSRVISLFYSHLGQEERRKNKTQWSYTTASSPSLPGSCRSWRAGTTPGWPQEGQVLCGALLQLREEKGPRTYPGDSSFHVSIQGKARVPWDLGSWWPQNQD